MQKCDGIGLVTSLLRTNLFCEISDENNHQDVSLRRKKCGLHINLLLSRSQLDGSDIFRVKNVELTKKFGAKETEFGF